LIAGALLIIESITLLYYSLLPYPDLPITVPSGKGYIEHFIAYFVYGFLLERVLKHTRLKNHRILLTLIIGSVFGGLNEIVQGFVPGRYTDIIDWLFDMVGSGIGGFVSKKFRKL
jgi:VanZ family protein